MKNNDLKSRVSKNVKEKIAVSNIRKEFDMNKTKVEKIKYVSISICAVFILVFGIMIGTNRLKNNQENNNSYKIADLENNKQAEKENINIELNINKIEHFAQLKFDARLKEIKNIDMKNFDILSNINIPNDFNNKSYNEIYVKEDNTGKYDRLYNYEFSYSSSKDNERNIRVAFSDTNKPLRDYYLDEEGKISKINDIELKIYQYEDSYMVIFEFKNYKFDIETNSITKDELLNLLESILLYNDKSNKEIEDKDHNVKEQTKEITSYKDYYAGRYIDNNGNNVVLLCKDNKSNRKEICRILGVTESKTIFKNAKYSYNYLTELQNKISDKMRNKELSFVVSSEVAEDINKIRIVVTTNSEEDINRVRKLDTLGGAILIKYNSESTANKDVLVLE